MESSKCCECKKDKDLVCCKDCMEDLIVKRIAESIQGDIANRVKYMIDEKFEEIEDKVKNELKDKLLVCVKRGRKLVIV